MNDNALFDIVFVVSAIMLIVAAGFAAVAPSVGIESPEAPQVPNFPSIDVGGNFNSTYLYDETHNCTWTPDVQVLYDDFSPDKKIDLAGVGGIRITRYGTDSIIPFWYLEPVYFTNGTKIENWIDSMTVNDVIALNTELGSPENVTFTVDYGSSLYEANIEFTPIAGYATLADSWNTGNGFTIRLYGDAYAQPDYSTQLINYLSFIGSVIGFVFLYIFFIFQMLGLILTLLGLSSVFAGIIVLVVTIFVGALLLYLKGLVSIGK